MYASGHIRTDINNTAANIYNTSSTQGQKYLCSLKKLEEETPFYGIGSLSHHCYQKGITSGGGDKLQRVQQLCGHNVLCNIFISQTRQLTNTEAPTLQFQV